MHIYGLSNREWKAEVSTLFPFASIRGYLPSPCAGQAKRPPYKSLRQQFHHRFRVTRTGGDIFRSYFIDMLEIVGG